MINCNALLSLLSDGRRYEVATASQQFRLKSFLLVNGILHKSRLKRRVRKLLVYIPKTMRADVLYACHDHVIAGHCGFTRTWEKVSSRFYFPQMLHYVRNYVETCKACQLRKTSNSCPRGYLQQIVKYGLLQAWSLNLSTSHPRKY